MKLFIAFLACIFLAASPIYKSGGKLYRVERAADGTPMFVLIPDQFIDLDAGASVPGSPDLPTDPGSPTIPSPGEFGLSAIAFEAATKLTPVERSKAANIRSAIMRAMDKTKDSNSLVEVSRAVQAEVQASFAGESPGGWSVWYATVTARIAELQTEGKISDVAKLRSALSAVVDGIGGVK